MDQNRDWKPVAALILAGLALLVALGGTRGYDREQVGGVPQQIIVQPAAPQPGPAGGATAPVITVPGAQTNPTRGWGGWHGGGHIFPFFPLIPLLFLAGLLFLVFRVIGPRRYGWGGPGWYSRPWGGPQGGPGPGPQAPPYGQPYGQQPEGQGQGQPYVGYPQGQPQQGQQWQQPQQPQRPEQGQQGQQGQSTHVMDAQGDITRPEGSGDY